MNEEYIELRFCIRCGFVQAFESDADKYYSDKDVYDRCPQCAGRQDPKTGRPWNKTIKLVSVEE